MHGSRTEEHTFGIGSLSKGTYTSSAPAASTPDTFGSHVLSIALIGPDSERRRPIHYALTGWQSSRIKEYPAYPANLDEIPKLLEENFDVIVIDLESDPEYALDLIEAICADGAPTVIVYSSKSSPEILMRCMRAGVREFLTEPYTANAVAEALVRASVRKPAVRQAAPLAAPPAKANGRYLVFLGAKGGAGTTTLACNFAVALTQESEKNVLLIDLDLPLGGVSIDLGLSAKYTVAEALENSSRLDGAFLSRLLVKHASGLSVLAAPGKFSPFKCGAEEIDKLLSVAREEFDYVVVDAGSRFDLTGTALFGKYATVYLVTQVGIPELRNSNVLVNEYFTTGIPNLEIVINRYMPRSLGVDEEHITRALTREPRWKIPNDYITTRRTQNLATPLALEDSTVSRAIRRMARVACGLPEEPEKKGADKKSRFVSLFG